MDRVESPTLSRQQFPPDFWSIMNRTSVVRGSVSLSISDVCSIEKRPPVRIGVDHGSISSGHYWIDLWSILDRPSGRPNLPYDLGSTSGPPWIDRRTSDRYLVDTLCLIIDGFLVYLELKTSGRSSRPDGSGSGSTYTLNRHPTDLWSIVATSGRSWIDLLWLIQDCTIDLWSIVRPLPGPF